MTDTAERTPLDSTLDTLDTWRRDLGFVARWLETGRAVWADLPQPRLTYSGVEGYPRLAVQCSDAETLARVTRALAVGASKGSVTKDYEGDDYVRVRRLFGTVEVEAWATRANVCERVEVGTEVVQEPAPGAPMVDVERPVYKWVCSPLLADTGGAS